MSAISAGLVKELREKTGAGMLDCKKALAESDGDIEKAIEFLRKKGIASADKKSSRLASEGLIHIAQSGNAAAIVEVNSETDFVAKNDTFKQFVADMAELVLKTSPKDLPDLLAQSYQSGTVEAQLKELVAKIGENLSLRRFARVEAGAGELIGSYTHMGSKIGVLVKIKGDSSKLQEAVRDIAMHTAAASPRYLHRDHIPEEVKAKEREIYQEQLKTSGKPAEMLDKIIEGKINKFAAEVSLIEQIFVKDPNGKNSVQQHLKNLDPNAAVLEFVRFQVGEGLEKKQEDFAAEVAKQLGQ